MRSSRACRSDNSGILNTPDVQQWFAAEGAESVNRTPEDFARLIVSEMVKWGKVVKAAGMKVQ